MLSMRTSSHFPTRLQEIGILGIPVTRLASYREAVTCITERIAMGDRLSCIAINPMKVCLAIKDPSFRRVVKSASMHICDGIGSALAIRLLYGSSVGRITGIQLFFDLVAAAETEGLRVFLLGASAESNELACRNLQKRHPRLKIVGRHHGYFTDGEVVVDAINAAEPHILFVGMGSPKQEQWMAEHRDRIDTPFVMGVGGTLDVVSGKVTWAPPLFRRTGTEFLYRTLKQPRRIKVLPTLFTFTGAVAKEYFRLRFSGKQSDAPEPVEVR